MNHEDADAVEFMEIASRLGYFGYSVMPAADGSRWYSASHPDRWTFGFCRWRQFLWLRCSVSLPYGQAVVAPALLDWVNDLRHGARLAKFHIGKDVAGETLVEASALLPFTYERMAFGSWILPWIQETSRITAPASKCHEQREPR